MIPVPSKIARFLGIEPTEELPSWAWPGGYPVIYLDEHDEVLCADCANDENERPTLAAVDVFYEGFPMWCAECNCLIVSAYGDPDATDEENDAWSKQWDDEAPKRAARRERKNDATQG